MPDLKSDDSDLKVRRLLEKIGCGSKEFAPKQQCLQECFEVMVPQDYDISSPGRAHAIRWSRLQGVLRHS